MEIKLSQVPEGIIKAVLNCQGKTWDLNQTVRELEKIDNLLNCYTRENKNAYLCVMDEEDKIISRIKGISHETIWRIQKDIKSLRNEIREEAGNMRNMTFSIHEDDLKDFLDSVLPGDEEE